MIASKLEILDRLFAAFGQHDIDGIRATMSDNATWVFPGHNSFSGVKSGIQEIVDFFDAIGQIMIQSNV